MGFGHSTGQAFSLISDLYYKDFSKTTQNRQCRCRRDVKYRFYSTGRWTAWHLYPLTQVPPLPQQQSEPSHYPEESLYTLCNWPLSLKCCRHTADPARGSSEMKNNDCQQ